MLDSRKMGQSGREATGREEAKVAVGRDGVVKDEEDGDESGGKQGRWAVLGECGG